MSANLFGNITTYLSISDSSSENGTNPTYKEEEISAALWAGMGITILVIGTAAHILSIVVMATSRTMRTQSSTVYLLAMAAAGIASLYTGLLRHIVTIGITNWKYDFRHSHDIVCRLHMMLSYASLEYFAWMQATVAVDRLISVLIPHKYMTSCKWKAALVVVVIELVAVLSLNSSVVASVALVDGNCDAVLVHYFTHIWKYLDFISFSLLPATIMCVCNISILYMLKRNQMKSRNRNDLTIMLMSLNVFFIITTLPISIIFFVEWGTYPSKRFVVIELWWTVFSLLQYAGAAGTFFVYCLTGSKFKEELRRLFRMQSRTSRRRTHTSASTTNHMQESRPYNGLKVSTADIDDNTSVVSL